MNDLHKGVYIYDISNPAQPERISFTLISNNVDIGVYSNALYADSYGDLLVYDISDLNEPVYMTRLSNVVTQGYDFWGWEDWEGGGWGCMFCGIPSYDSGSTSGTGGSTARFAIVDHYLYGLNSGYSINVFDLSDPLHPVEMSNANISRNDAETLFPYENYLFVGASTGVYIYDISTLSNPTYVAEFRHLRASDPVVVQNDIAYVTLRNVAEQPRNRFEIIDISDLSNMSTLHTIEMNIPYGLGVQGDFAYVCDHWVGLKIFDIRNVRESVEMIQLISNINPYDIIPNDDHLIISGSDIRLYTTNFPIELIATLE